MNSVNGGRAKRHFLAGVMEGSRHICLSCSDLFLHLHCASFASELRPGGAGLSGGIMRQLLVWGSLVGVLALAAPAGAGERSWYMGLEGGLEFDGDGSSNETGWAGLITLGGGITSHINLEAELGYRSTSVDTIFSLVDIQQTSLMFNALYEAPLSKEVSFVVGFGVGGENVSYDGFVFGADENEIEIAAQVKVGLNIALSDNTDLAANYRYMTTVGDLDITNSTLTVGISFDL